MGYAKIAWPLLVMLRLPRAHNQDGPFEGDLEGWLASVKIVVPDDAIKPIDAYFKILGVAHSAKIEVHSLECDGLRVGKTLVDGNEQKRANGGLSSHVQGRDVEVRLEKVAISCRGTVRYSTSMGFSGSANAIVSMDDAQLSTTLRLTSLDEATPEIPNNLETLSCASKLKLQLDIVSGTAVTRLAEHIPGLVGKLQNMLNTKLDEYMCSSVLDGARGHLSTLLDDMHSAIGSYTDTTEPECPSWVESFMPLEDVPLLNWARRFSGRVVHNHYIGNAVNFLYPTGYWPLVGRDEWALRQPTCILGSNNDTTNCAAARSLHEHPPAVLRVDLNRADLGANISGLDVSGQNALLACSGNASRAHLQAVIQMTFDGWAGGAEARNLSAEVAIDVMFGSTNLSGAFFVGLDRQAFNAEPIWRYLAVGCLAPSVRQLQAIDFTANLQIEQTSISLLRNVQVSSPLLAEAVELASNLLNVIASYETAMVAVLNGFLRQNLTMLVTKRLHDWASGLQHQQCPVSPGQETEGGKHLPLINPGFASFCMWTAAVLALAAGAVSVVLPMSVAYLGSKDEVSCGETSDEIESTVALAGWTCQPEASLSSAEDNYHSEESRSRHRCHAWWFRDALCNAVTVPRHISVGMILALVACLFFLMGSNFLPLAASFLNLESQTDSWLHPRSSVRVYNVLMYSLFYSIKALSEHGASLRVLSVVIAIFSGVLPYTKLLAMIFCWICPVALIPVSWRGRILWLLDQIGKYSLVDVFIIQFISGTLYTTISVGDDADPEADPLVVALRTNLAAGFISFVLATVGSLILGHICLHYHERDPLTTSCRDHTDACTELLLPAKVAKSRCSVSDVDTALHGSRRWYVAPFLVLNLLLVTCGCALPAFQINLRSPPLAGNLIPLDGTFSKSSYSVYGFVAKLPELSEEPNSFKTRFSQFTFVFFVIVCINLHVMMMLHVWMCKVSSRKLALVHPVAHFLFVCSSLDVALISMVITLVEMEASDIAWMSPSQQHFVGKVVGTPYPSRHGVRVSISLGAGTWVLFLAALLHNVIGRFALALLERAVSALDKWQDETSRPPSPHPSDGEVGSLAKGFFNQLASDFNGFVGNPKRL